MPKKKKEKNEKKKKEKRKFFFEPRFVHAIFMIFLMLLFLFETKLCVYFCFYFWTIFIIYVVIFYGFNILCNIIF